MSILETLKPDYRAVVFGASGGIGGALVKLLARDAHCAHIYTGSRKRLTTGPKCTPFEFDLLDEDSIARASQKISAEGEIDLVMVATGLLHLDTLKPEKGMRWLAPQALAHSYAVNAVGPALIAKHMLSLLPRDRKSAFAALSARVGSISDNRLGGWHAYRASKAGLNQLVRTCAIELAAKNKHAVCVTLHPGTVDTSLSKPFQAGVAAGKLFTPEVSAGYLLQVVNTLTPTQSGQCLSWDGSVIPY